MAVYLGDKQVNMLGGQPIIVKEEITEVIVDGEAFAYSVVGLGTTYGFTLNDNGYYESQNKGVDDSFAICRVLLTVKEPCDITFKVINYAESSWDYGLFGILNTELEHSNSVDSNDKLMKNFSGQSSTDVVDVVYANVPTGNHFIDVKFRKDSSQSSGNDSVQFKIEDGLEIVHECVGLDTSDATATASDMAAGVTAYVNGEKITGNLSDSSTGWMLTGTPYALPNSTEFDKIGLQIRTSNVILRESGTSYVTTSPSNFGDATPEDVVQGKTFTSSSGLKVSGNVREWNVNSSYSNVAFQGISNPGTENQNLVVTADTNEDILIRQGNTIWINAPKENFGNATSSDVLAGKTFTSENGVKITGAATSLGGGSSYTGDLYSYGTATVNPASGVSQVQFNNIPKEPDYWVLYLNEADINQYHRAGVIMYDGEKVMGHELYSGTYASNYYENDKNPSGSAWRWKATYSGTTLTISSYSNSQGGYFHNPGTYTLLYAYKDNENGTVAIEKYTEGEVGAIQTITVRGVDEVPEWFFAMPTNSIAPEDTDGDVMFITKSGLSTIKSNSYDFAEASGTWNLNGGNLLLHTINGNKVATGDYVILYAYEPASNTIVDTSDATASADDILLGETAYVKGKKVTGTLESKSSVTFNGTDLNFASGTTGTVLIADATVNSKQALVPNTSGVANVSIQFNDRTILGDASPSDVASGKTFTSSSGIKLTGTASVGGGSTVKSGATTSNAINTGLSSVDKFIIWKDGVAETGLMQGVYDKTNGTTYTYCSAWSTSTWGSKTFATGTTVPTISGGTVTWTTTTNHALSSGKTYNWIAIGS